MSGGPLKRSPIETLLWTILLVVVFGLLILLKNGVERLVKDLPLPARAPSVADEASQPPIPWQPHPRRSERLLGEGEQ